MTAKVWDAASGKELLTLKGHRMLCLAPWPFPRTASGLSPAVMITRPRCGRRPVARNCSPSKGTAVEVRYLWPFPRTASGLSPAAVIRRPRCGRRPAAGNCSPLKGTALRICPCGLFSRRPADCHRQRDQTAKVWDAASGKELLTLRGHSAGFCVVAFSPDGQRIVTGSRSDGQGVGGRRRPGTRSPSGAQRSDSVGGLFPGRPADRHRQF